VDGVSKYRAEVVKNTFSPFATALTRSNAWAAITVMVNDVGMVGRTASQVEKKWFNHKTNILTSIHKHQNEIHNTGKTNFDKESISYRMM